MGGTSIRNCSRVAPNANFIPQFAEPRQRCKPTSARGNIRKRLKLLRAFRKVVDQFFDGVMVMAENEAVRSNRLALLGELLREFTTVAAFL